MKVVYFNMDEEKLFDIKVNKLDSITEEDIVTGRPSAENDYKKLLDYVNEEIFIFAPLDDGKDFYLKYFNHVNYFNDEDNNFKIGARLSRTIARNDKKGNLLKFVRNIYKTGKKEHGIVKYLNDDGKLIKYLHYHYFMMNERLIVVHDDQSEIKMHRDSLLNDENLGIAIYQNNHFVEVNENYAKSVAKTREQLLGAAQDLRGVPEDVAKKVKENVAAINNQDVANYKTPMVSYDENGDIRYYINAEGSYIVYDNMPAVLFKIKDLTEQERAKRLNKSNDDSKVRNKSTLRELLKYSKTFITYAIYPDKYYVSDNFYDIIEDENRDYIFKEDTLREFVMSEDLKLYDEMIASLSPNNSEVEFVTSMMTLKFNIKYVKHFFKRIYDSEGHKISYFSAHQDITDEALYSNSLKKQIFEQNEVIKNKNIQIKEAHHTIKNNLNILISLIRMEEHYNKDPSQIVDETKSHLKSISVMHEKLYQSKNLKDLELKEFLDSIVESLFDIYASDIKYVSKIDNIILNSDQASTLALIINELINNSVKYAFNKDDEDKVISIKLSRLDKDIEVVYRDSGKGIPDDVNFNNPDTLGLIVIQNLTKQLDGTISYEYDNGTCIKLLFKEKDVFNR